MRDCAFVCVQGKRDTEKKNSSVFVGLSCKPWMLERERDEEKEERAAYEESKKVDQDRDSGKYVRSDDLLTFASESNNLPWQGRSACCMELDKKR